MLPPDDLAATVRRWLGDWRLLGLAGSAVVALAWAYSWPYWDNRLILTVRTTALGFQLGQPSDLIAPAQALAVGSPLRLFDLPELDLAPHLDLSGRNSRFDVSIAGRSVLRRLSIGEIGKNGELKNGELRIVVDPADGADLFLNGPAELKVAISPDEATGKLIALDVVDRTGAPIPSLKIPEPFELHSKAEAPQSRIRIRLPHLPKDGEFAFAGEIAITSLRFGREQRDASDRTRFISAITGGKLELKDIGTKPIELQPGSPIRLETFRGTITRLRVTRDDIVLQLVGTASRVRVGPEGFEDDLTPSVLSYVFNQQGLKTLWATLAFVLAGLWKIRGWARQ